MASEVGVLATETIDRLYDSKTEYIENSVNFLKRNKDINRLAQTTGLPLDALNILRLADLKSQRPDPKPELEVKIETS